MGVGVGFLQFHLLGNIKLAGHEGHATEGGLSSMS